MHFGCAEVSPADGIAVVVAGTIVVVFFIGAILAELFLTGISVRVCVTRQCSLSARAFTPHFENRVDCMARRVGKPQSVVVLIKN